MNKWLLGSALAWPLVASAVLAIFAVSTPQAAAEAWHDRSVRLMVGFAAIIAVGIYCAALTKIITTISEHRSLTGRVPTRLTLTGWGSLAGIVVFDAFALLMGLMVGPVMHRIQNALEKPEFVVFYVIVMVLQLWVVAVLEKWSNR